MKTVAILYEILSTVLLFSCNRLYPIYSNLQKFAKNQDIKIHLGSYDVVHYSAHFDTFKKALVSLDSILFTISCFSYNRLIRIDRLSQNRS